MASLFCPKKSCHNECWPPENLAQKFLFKKFRFERKLVHDKYFLNRCCLDKYRNPLDHLIFMSIGCMPGFSLIGYVENLVQNIFVGTNVSWTNVVWRNITNPLDHLIFVSIGCMPNFRLMHYVEDEFLKGYLILVPAKTTGRQMSKWSISLCPVGNQIKLSLVGNLELGPG